MRLILSKFVRLNLFSLVCAALLAGCDTGGPAQDSDAGSGNVSILFTDAPSDDFSAINVTVSAIELRGGDHGPVRVFDGPARTFDLLNLQNFSEVFSIAGSVPADRYSKIRLFVDDLALVPHDVAMAPIHPPLPANGKLDLNPGHRFRVLPGGTLLVEIDIDAKKSVHIRQTGNGGYRFRPVIKVRILNTEDSQRLTRVSGAITGLDRLAGGFAVCDPQIAMHDGDDSDSAGSADSDSDSDGGRRGDDACIDVTLLADSSIFDSNGDAATVDALFEGDPVTVIGRLRADADDDSDSDSGDSDSGDSDPVAQASADSDSSRKHGRFRVALDATVVEIGPADTFARLDGTVTSAVDAVTGLFDFDVDGDEAIAGGTTLAVQLQATTRIVSKSTGEDLDSAAIATALRAEIDGIVVPAMVPPDILKSVLIVLDDAPAASMLSGTVASADPATARLVLSGGGGCIDTTPATDVFVITVNESAASSRRGDFSDLTVGATIDAFGMLNATSGCFDAEAVLVLVD